MLPVGRDYRPLQQNFPEGHQLRLSSAPSSPLQSACWEGDRAASQPCARPLLALRQHQSPHKTLGKGIITPILQTKRLGKSLAGHTACKLLSRDWDLVVLTMCFGPCDIWGHLDPGEMAPDRANHFLEIVAPHL